MIPIAAIKATFCLLILAWPLAAGDQPSNVHHDLEVAYHPNTRLLHIIDRIDMQESGTISLRVARWLEVRRVAFGDVALMPVAASSCPVSSVQSSAVQCPAHNMSHYKR